MQATAFPPQSISFTSYATTFIQNAPYREQKNGKPGLSTNTLKSYQNFFNIWLKFEQQFDTPLGFKELDQNKITLSKQWLLEDRKYRINNVGRILSALKTICLDAQKNDIPTHPYVNFIRVISQLRQQKIIHTLSFQEIKKIESCTVPQNLENAKSG